MSIPNERKAIKELNSAMSTLNRKFGLGNKYKQAIPKLQNAASIFRTLNINFQAATTYQTLAECYMKLNDSESQHLAGEAYENAAECHMNFQDQTSMLEKSLGDLGGISEGLKAAAYCYRSASNIAAERGDLMKAAKLETQAGDAFEEVMLVLIKSRARLEERRKNELELNKNVEEVPQKKEEMESTDRVVENTQEEEHSPKSTPETTTPSSPMEDEMMKRIKEEMSEKFVSQEDIDAISASIQEACTRGTEHYIMASDYHEAQSNYPNANTALKRCIQIAMDGGEYRIAIRTIEKLFDADWNQAKSSTRSRIHFDSNTLLYKLIVCKLMMMKITEVEMNLEMIRSLIDMYEEKTNNFQHSREGELILAICHAFEKKDLHIFLRAITTFEKAGKLDDDNTKYLLKVRRKLEEFIGRIEESSLV